MLDIKRKKMVVIISNIVTSMPFVNAVESNEVESSVEYKYNNNWSDLVGIKEDMLRDNVKGIVEDCSYFSVDSNNSNLNNATTWYSFSSGGMVYGMLYGFPTMSEGLKTSIFMSAIVSGMEGVINYVV